MNACRNCIESLWPEDGILHADHAGLVMDRFLTVPVKEKEHPDKRAWLFKSVIEGCSAGKEIYSCAFSRYSDLLTECGKTARFQTMGRLIVGLGNENVLESGLCLHHTYGVPIIPGTALKGLASHYCNQVWKEADPRFGIDGEFYSILFGTTDDSGHITFYDGWITPDTVTGSVRHDVITPHHAEYYAGTGAAPTDYDDPNPVTFLSVSGTFFIGVSCDVTGENGDRWADLALELVSKALIDMGIGGKTHSGYGRMERIMVKKVRRPEADMKPVGLPEFGKGEIIPVLVIPDPRNKGRIVFKASDGYYGFMADGIDPPVREIGERTELKVKEHRDSYWFTLP